MSNYRALAPRITFGTDYTGSLTLRYPLSEVTSYGQSREDSTLAVAPSGIEDAWVTGDDEFLKGTIHHIPQTGSDGATGWDDENGYTDFLTVARTKELIRYHPDGRNVIVYGELNTVDGIGVATGFTSFTSLTDAVFSLDDEAQRVTVTASHTGSYRQAGVKQTYYDVRPGEVFSARLDAKLSYSGTCRAIVVLQYWSANGVRVLDSGGSTNTQDAWTTITNENRTAPLGTAYLSIEARFEPTVAGSTGSVWFKNLTVFRSTTAPTEFIPNPFTTAYLMEPMNGGVALDPNGERSMDLILRASGSGVFNGY